MRIMWLKKGAQVFLGGNPNALVNIFYCAILAFDLIFKAEILIGKNPCENCCTRIQEREGGKWGWKGFLQLVAALTGGQRRHKCTNADAILVFFVTFFVNCIAIVLYYTALQRSTQKLLDFHSSQRQRHSVTTVALNCKKERESRHVICLQKKRLASHL